MEFSQKREKFANEQRQKHRNEILRIRRNQGDKAELIGSQIKNSKNRSHDFYQESLSKIHAETIDESIKNGVLKQILENLPEWIIFIADLHAQNEKRELMMEEKMMVGRLVEICNVCLKKEVLAFEATNCLVEITTLPVSYLNSISITEDYLVNLLFNQIFDLFMMSTDIRIIFNCVYICGNLHGTMVRLMTAEDREGYNTVEKIQTEVVNKLLDISSKYLHYDKGIELLLWYIKNCVLTKSAKEDRLPHFYFLDVISRVLLTICTRIATSYSQNLGEDCTHFYSLLTASFDLLYFLVTDETLLQKSNFNNNSQRLIYEVINECVSVFLQIYLQFDKRVKKEEIKYCERAMRKVAMSMSEILHFLKQIPNFPSNIPQYIPNLCFLFTQNLIPQVDVANLCLEFFKVLCSTHMPISFITKNMLENCEKIFESEAIVVNSEYRLNVLMLWMEIQETISSCEMKRIVNEIGKLGMYENKEIERTGEEFYQDYMIENVIPYILNIIELMFIEETESKSVGLKIILNLTLYWEVSEKRLRNMIISMDIHKSILSLQEDSNEEVYDAALRIIEELQLDDLEF